MSSTNDGIIDLNPETPIGKLLGVLRDIISGESRVHSLRLRGVFPEEVIYLVVDIIRDNCCIRNIQMDGTFLDDSIGVRIAGALGVNTNIYNLSLSYNSFGDSTGRAFADALKVNTSLRSLNFNRNKLGPETGRAFAEALKVNTSLLFLDLSYNELGWDGVVPIGEALKYNRTLHKLDLRKTFFGDEPGVVFVKALTVNCTLKVLILSGNGLGNITVSSLVVELPKIWALTSLDLSASLPEDVVQKVSGALWSNYSLCTLYLTDSFKSLNSANSGALWRNCDVPRSIEVIQRAWHKCRWDPEYPMCWKFQLGNLKRDTGLDLDEEEPQPGE